MSIVGREPLCNCSDATPFLPIQACPAFALSLLRTIARSCFLLRGQRIFEHTTRWPTGETQRIAVVSGH